MVPEPWRVRRVRRDTYDTSTLELEPVSPGVEFTFAPGQFNMIYVFGVGEVPISISGDPASRRLVAHTVRAVGTVTRALTRLRKGATVGIRGPYGSCWPVEEVKGRDIAFIAGGIGLVPLRPAIHSVLAQRDRYGRLLLLYGARTPRDLLFARELERWNRKFDLHVQTTVDAAAGDWSGHVGVVTTLIPRLALHPDTIAMICGPEVMMRFTLAEVGKARLGTYQTFISMERNMKCAIGLCGHCQFGPTFICKDGPVFRYDRIQDWFLKRAV